MKTKMRAKMKTWKKVLIIVGILPMLAIVAIASIALMRSYNLSDPTEHSFTSVEDESAPVVYMTADISPKGLISAYEALGVEAAGNVGVKLHMGEPGGRNFLSPDLIKDLVQSLDGTIVENNIVGGMGQRGSTTVHMQVAKDHGFTAIAPVDILDADGEISIPVQNGKRLTEHLVGSGIDNYDFLVVLSHFKGHTSAGFGGAIKNVAVGLASPNGKAQIHGTDNITNMIFRMLSAWGQKEFAESLAEATGSVIDHMDGNIVYINVMNRLSIDCDCVPNPAEPDMHDVGILASTDPVALDKASVDLVYSAPDGQSLIERIESLNGLLTLAYADEIGVGNLEYRLISIDD